MENKTIVQLRLNNTLFQCKLDGKFYNLKDKKAYAVALASGLIPTAQNQFTINMEAMIICEDCWKDNKDKGLGLQEPSPIVAAPADALNHLKKDPVRN